MIKNYLTITLLAFISAFSINELSAQQRKVDKKVIIIEKTIDNDGTVLSKKIVKEGEIDIDVDVDEVHSENVIEEENFEVVFNSSAAQIGVVVIDFNNFVKITEVVDDSPAERSGLLVDDLILNIDDVSVDSTVRFWELIDNYQPDDTIKLAISRNAEKSYVNVTLK